MTPPRPRTFLCQNCGNREICARFGRIPIWCEKCNPKSRLRRDRDNEGMKRKAKSKKTKKNRSDYQNAGRLAVGLNLHATAEHAAGWAGLDPDILHLDRLEDLAKAHYSDVIDGSPGGLAKRLISMMNSILISTEHNIDDISPRDRLNAVRQCASARDLLIGQAPSTDFATINLTVIGAQGTPIKVNEEPDEE